MGGGEEGSFLVSLLCRAPDYWTLKHQGGSQILAPTQPPKPLVPREIQAVTRESPTGLDDTGAGAQTEAATGLGVPKGQRSRLSIAAQARKDECTGSLGPKRLAAHHRPLRSESSAPAPAKRLSCSSNLEPQPPASWPTESGQVMAQRSFLQRSWRTWSARHALCSPLGSGEVYPRSPLLRFSFETLHCRVFQKSVKTDEEHSSSGSLNFCEPNQNRKIA